MMKWQDFLVVQWLPQALNLGALVQSLVRELDPSCPRGKNSHASREKKKNPACCNEDGRPLVPKLRPSIAK